MSGFKDLLDQLPELTDLWLKTDYADPKSGMIITKLSQDSVLIPPRFGSSLLVQTNQGNINLTFTIEANTIEEAMRGWNAAAKKAVADLEVQMRENSRKIVLPSPPMRHGVPHG